MKKIQIGALREDLPQLSKILQELGVIEVTGFTETDPDQGAVFQIPADFAKQISETDRQLAEIARSLGFLEQVVPVKPNMIEQFAGIKTYITPAEREQFLAKDSRLTELMAELQRCEMELSQIQAERAKVTALVETFSVWESLDISWEALQGNSNIQIVLSTVTMTSTEAEAAFKELETPYYLEVVSENQNGAQLLLSFKREHYPEVQQILGKINANVVYLPDYGSSVQAKLGELHKDIARLDATEKSVREKVRILNTERPLLQVFYDYYLSEKTRLETLERFAFSERCFVMTGWVPAEQLPRIDTALKRNNIRYVMEEIQPEPDEEIPTILKNSKWATPFEYLIHSYSLPQYKEIDPTPIIAPFFFIFFGIAMGDAGYGLILALICAALLVKLKMGPMGRRISWMFLISGFGAVIFGLITGSVLSLENINFGLFNPLENPILLLIIALGLGVVQLFLGLFISAYATIREGRWMDALCNQGTLIFFLAMAILVMIKDAIGLSLYSNTLMYLFLIAAAIMVLANVRGKKGILGFIGGILGGFYNIYGTIGFFSDILSYSRLMALGLSGGVMGGIMNQLAWMLVEGIPVLGWILGAAVFLFGHSLNLALSLLGAYVHSSRLQYLEFFGKFFEGGGKPFTPLENKQKYTFVINEREA
ncbi:MAG TPA: V-type ATPase 116kDa subunit family protein [Bacillota bacterium]|nr:V-type ATPase 116kDa subunit family protein [Bacillota bacterium]